MIMHFSIPPLVVSILLIFRSLCLTTLILLAPLAMISIVFDKFLYESPRSLSLGMFPSERELSKLSDLLFKDIPQ
jgi:hypothetical protein